jgi:Flp pilus assembly pilin Flp
MTDQTAEELGIQRSVPGFVHLLQHDEGQDLVEYALVGTVVILGAIAGLSRLAPNLATMFTNVASNI